MSEDAPSAEAAPVVETAPIVAPVEAAPAPAPAAEAPPAAAAPEAPQQPGESAADYKARVHGLTKALAEARGELYRMKREKGAATPAAAPAAINIPDADEDPHGAIKAMRDLALQMASDRQSEAERAATDSAQTQYVNELKSAYDASEREYGAVQPDYRDGAQHYVKSRMSELQLLGVSEGDAQRAVYNEFLKVTDFALQNGRVPAELIYTMAQQRGYAPAPPPPPPPPVVDPLLAIEAGQAAARTLSDAAARTPAAEGGTPEAQIANLSGAALRSAWDKIKRDRWAAA